MKNKSIQLSNFEFSLNNKHSNNNELIIEDFYNINTNNGYLQTELHMNNFLSELFDENIAILIKNNNKEILKNLLTF